jgi:hypothetical protein
MKARAQVIGRTARNGDGVDGAEGGVNPPTPSSQAVGRAA